MFRVLRQAGPAGVKLRHMSNIPPRSGQRQQPGREQVLDAAASAGLNLPEAAVVALQQGRLIEAIKLIRTANPGLDLARAKAVMERVQAQARAATADLDTGFDHAGKPPPPPMILKRPPTVATGDPPGMLRWLLLLVALVAAAVWIGFAGTF